MFATLNHKVVHFVYNYCTYKFPQKGLKNNSLKSLVAVLQYDVHLTFFTYLVGLVLGKDPDQEWPGKKYPNAD